MSEHQYTPLWKQLLGAATGAIVALLLYRGFAAASPTLSLFTAYLLGDFEEKIENMLAYYPQSPRAVRDEAIAMREALGDRALAATARLQKGEQYFVVPPPSVRKEGVEVPKEQSGPSHVEEKKEKKRADKEHKEEKLPDTGIPLWLIGGVAFGLAMAVRYRKELLCSPSPCGRG